MIPTTPIEKKVKLPPNWKKGVALILSSWIFLVIAIELSRGVSLASSVPIVLLFQNLICFLFMIPWVVKTGRKSLYLAKFGVIVLRSIAGYISFAFVILAVQRTSLVNVVLLSNSAPLFIPLVLWIWKGVRLKKQLWLGILIGFIGIGIILNPTNNVINFGALFALGSAFCSSISMIAQRRLVKTESIPTILFYYFAINVIISIPFAVETWQPLTLPISFFLLIIALSFGIGQLLFLWSFKFEKPSFLSSFSYSAVVYGLILEWILGQHFPSWRHFLGIFIVCLGGIITILQGNGGSIKPKEKQDPAKHS